MDIGWYRMIWDAEASLWIFMKFVTDYLHPWEEQVLKKKAKGPHCGDCGKALIGLPRLRPIEYMRCDECPALLCLIWYIYISFQVHPESTWYCTVEQHMGHTADATPQTFLSNPSDSLRLIKSGSGSFKIYIYRFFSCACVSWNIQWTVSMSGQDYIWPTLQASASTCMRLKQREKRVNRAYGGSRCAHCVRQRIVRAFLIEESARGAFCVAMGNHEVGF